MACEGFEERIQRDLDGELASDDRFALQEHLAACASCRAEREFFGRIDEALRRGSSPAPPRRDFAGEALHRVESVGPAATRPTTARSYGGAWITLGLAGVLLLVGTILGLVWYSARSPKTPVENPEFAETEASEDVVPRTEVKTTVPETVIPRVAAPSPEQLRKLYPFGEVEPIGGLAEVALQMAATESSSDRLRLLGRGLEVLLDGFADACAHGRMGEAAEFSSAVNILVQDAWIPLLLQLQEREIGAETKARALALSDAYNRLMAFARELPRSRKSEVEKVLASCAEGRDAARDTARRLGAP